MINRQKPIEALEEVERRFPYKVVGKPDTYSEFNMAWESCMDCVFSAVESQPPADQWIPCSERLPNKEEYLKDDGRFIVTDGNRRYQCIFDIYTGKFKRYTWNKLLEEDKFAIAWKPMGEPYKGE